MTSDHAEDHSQRGQRPHANSRLDQICGGQEESLYTHHAVTLIHGSDCLLSDLFPVYRVDMSSTSHTEADCT